MDGILKKPYQISLWKDVLYYILEDNKEGYPIENFPSNNSSKITGQYYKEIKICDIGSNTMEAPIRALSPKLVSNVNGSNTLTFDMYQNYWDEISDQLEWNPFFQYLTNERKVKLHYNNKWYDFVIKKIEEDSVTKKFTYTCIDSSINELSKSGFELEFNTELENNIGTIDELSDAILKGSDWQRAANNNLQLYEFIQEPLYEYITTQEFSLSGMLTGNTKCPKGQKLLVFYSTKDESEWQVLYDNKQLYLVDKDNVIIEKNEDNNSTVYNYTMSKPNEAKLGLYNSQGRKLIKTQKTEFDNIVGKYVKVFDKNGIEYRGYQDIKYTSAATTSSYVANHSSFTNTAGWMVGKNSSSQTFPKLEIEVVPTFKNFDYSNYENFDGISYLKFTPPSGGGQLVNTGINSFASQIKEFKQGEKYLFRAKIFTDINTSSKPIDYNFYISEYVYEDGKYNLITKNGSKLFEFTNILLTPEADTDLFRYDITSIYSDSQWKNNIKNSGGMALDYTKLYLFGQTTPLIPWFYTKEKEYTTNINDMDTNYPYVYFNINGRKTKLYYLDAISRKWKPIFTISEDKKIDYAVPENYGNYIYSDYPIQYLIHQGFECKYSITEAELKNKRIGIFMITNGQTPIYIQDVQFFKYIKVDYDSDGVTEVISPAPFMVEPEISMIWKLYQSNKNYKDISEIPFIESKDLIGFTPKYSDNNQFKKIRTITAKESNRFNLIQSLCEIFEVWAKFEILHEPNGAVSLEEIVIDNKVIGYRQKKYIHFLKYIGKKNSIGFRYGINLKSIKRNLDSNGIISKLIVKNNSNEFAKDGFCSIARADENETKDNVIYNFDYFISQKLLKQSDIQNDLYSNLKGQNGYLCYYQYLKEYNTQLQYITDLQIQITKDLMNYESNYQVYKSSYDAALENLKNQEIAVQNLTNHSFSEFTPEYKLKAPGVGGWTGWQYWKINEETGKYELVSSENSSEATHLRHNLWDNDEFLKYAMAIAYNQAIIKDHKIAYENQLNLKTQAENKIKNLQDDFDEILEKKKQLNKRFYEKYSHFIQEGSWISEDYIDDNLYYLDSISTLHTSSKPQVSYTIEVIELSALPEYENYIFNLGDKSFIEDVEFFGWSLSDQLTPYKEEIIVSETIDYLDEPDKNVIKVQNYKTQFEDLFQRITATTQQIQFSTGEYERAASVVDSNNSFSSQTLQNSLNNNAYTIQNAKNQSVIIGNDGITTINLTNPAEVLKITSGGLFASRDAGNTWTSGFTANGINASYLTTGQLDASVINIVTGSSAAFRWDNKGISAYEMALSTNGKAPGVYNGTFVRFDQYGIYGIKNQDNFDAQKNVNGQEEALQNIFNNAYFSLTWKGLKIKSEDKTKGYISITSDNDFQVYDANNNEIIKIGKIDEYYGLQIKNSDNIVVMETDNSGSLWLKNKMSIETSEGLSVAIGKLENKQVINANDTFIVYEDGTLKATKGEFEGEIKATSGSFKGTIDATGGSFGGIIIDGINQNIHSKDYENDVKGFQINADGTINAYQVNLTGIINATGGSFSEKIDVNGTLIIGDNEQAIVINNDVNYNNGNNYIGIYSISYLNNSNSEQEVPGFYISPDGTITANNLFINHGTIEHFIKIGDLCIIRKPNSSSDSIISITDDNEKEVLAITQAGQLALGYVKTDSPNGIILDGRGAFIKSADYSNGMKGWFVDGDRAEFNDVNIRGKLSTTILAYGEVQTVGGVLLVRPSSLVREAYENTKDSNFIRVIVDEVEAGFKEGDYCEINTPGSYVDNKERFVIIRKEEEEDTGWSGYIRYNYEKEENGKLIFYREEDGNKTYYYFSLLQQFYINNNGKYTRAYYPYSKDIEYYIQKVGLILQKIKSKAEGTSEPDNKINYYTKSSSFKTGDTLVNWGQGEDNVAIAINSSADAAAFTPQAITVFQTELINNSLVRVPRIKLGKMSAEDTLTNGLEGYGLYADNVYLNGSLVLKDKDESGKIIGYSGINTKNKIQENESYFNDPGKIIIWAGAKGSENDEIQAAPFRVDSNGNLYAGQGYFIGSILTEATIEAARIKTAILEGSNSELPALRIINTKLENGKGGVSFGYGIYNESSKEIEGYIETLRITSLGLEVKNSNFISIEETTGNVSFNTFASSINSTYIEIKNDQIQWFKKDNYGNLQTLQKICNINGELRLGNSNGNNYLYIQESNTEIGLSEKTNFNFGSKMTYKYTDNGYELYVY